MCCLALYIVLLTVGKYLVLLSLLGLYDEIIASVLKEPQKDVVVVVVDVFVVEARAAPL